MKPWVEKLLLAVSFILWIFCFWNFFAQRLPLFADAISYRDHILFYTDSLSKGVFPLWDPTWFYGAPNEFFLRRMGEVNPFFFLIILLKWAGVSSAAAYLVFIGLYYFLAALGVYLIARLLFTDRLVAFAAYILFLFSSWGSEIFYNYIIIIFVPIIWSFFFLLCFGRKPQRSSLLGLSLCLGLIATTYIPFFFVIILTVFTFFFIFFYPRSLADFFKKSLSFFAKHKFFSFICAAFLLISCIPGLAFYKESKSGGFVLPGRHFGNASASSAVTVGAQATESGDLVSHGYFDRLFDDQAHLDMGDIFIPYVFFLVLLISIPARINKLIYFLLFNILMLFLITITTASRINAFLYGHLFFLKFIRQIYYLFWLGILPMAILLSAAALKPLLEAISASSRKAAWLAVIITAHLAFAGFLLTRQGVLAGAWAAMALSLVFFIVYWRWGNRASRLALCLLLAAVFIQSAQVYAQMDKKLFAGLQEQFEYQKAHISQKPSKMELYYATHWFSALVDFMDPASLHTYLEHRFILYDNVFPYEENMPFFKTFDVTAAAGGNVAYLPKFESTAKDWQSKPGVLPEADIHPLKSGKLLLVHADANTWRLKARLPYRQFLVINDNYDTRWHATINGRPAHLYRANVAFKGLWLPAGQSDILLRFADPWNYVFRWALIVIFAAVFLSLLALLTREKPCLDGT
ncbi:MAG: hypothetical protein KGK03_05545 [Candidatus Omnitrophica bacterium]|nr:hypothetical protein [Candidatus Omnitrophota bacterium]MDE2222521.1 hypothetical protein [Candidatus Omnitrophota bacterium]